MKVAGRVRETRHLTTTVAHGLVRFTHPTPRDRRGVLLLVILAMLAMFGLVAVAFVLITGHAMRSSLSVQRMGQYGERAEQDLQSGLMQALRGSNNPGSVMGPYGFLEDVYGNGGQTGRMTGVQAVCGGQLFEFQYQLGPSAAGTWSPDPLPYTRLGCVLTMLDGAAAGQSTLIVGANPQTGNAQALAFEQGAPAAGQQFVINSAPFSGQGVGFNPASPTGLLDAVDSNGVNFALRPNPAAPSDLGSGKTALEFPIHLNGPDGIPNTADDLWINEDYDAVDLQNMLLAAQIVDRSTGAVTTIPSLHRPALVRYWMNLGQWASNRFLRRKVLLRPLPEDHPNFDGSNPAFDPVVGPWDVDNDDDTVPDGIWVDLAMPVRSTADGRLYKPLFSFLCLDMDGRLNLNAHGCLAQLGEDYYGPVTPGNYRFAGGGAAQLPRGQGYGPPEVNLRPLFEDPANPGALLPQWQTFYGQLLGGAAALGLDGRYGEYAGTPRPGLATVDDWLSQNKWTQYGGNYWGFMGTGPYQLDAFGTPFDLNGNSALGLDPAGRPVYWLMAEQNEQVDDPYEIDLSRNRAYGLTSPAPVDNPFGPAELERLLRPYDRDASRLPRRLFDLNKPDPTNPLSVRAFDRRRRAVATESWDLPGPAVPLPASLRITLVARLFNGGVDQATIPVIMRQLLPPELLAGLRMDLNRPLGNGRDDNGNGVVDEPGEANEQVTLYGKPGATVSVPLSYDPDGTAPNSLAARQLQARYLYVLLLLLADTDSLSKTLGSDEAAVRFLAQWAVNVVDFYDRDSIMTPFPFDPDPFDASGWNPPAGSTYVVWGCERPELLITEALAFHDWRTQDTKEDPEGKTTQDDEPDEDFDQKRRPEGSLFLEFLNPWTAMEPPHGEFSYNRGTNSWVGGVRLNQTASNGDPVWRVIIVEPEEDPNSAGEPADPDDPVAADRPKILRSVYFIDLSTSTFNDPQDGQAFHPSKASTIAPVMPGRYVVVGPGDPGAAGPEYTTYLGERNDGEALNKTRRIVLTPAANADTMQVAVLENKNGAATDLPIAAIKPAVAVVIDKPKRLNISEPVEYAPNDPNGDPYDEASGGYPTPYDQPLDPGPEVSAEVAAALKKNATTTGVCIVHLQRLANPLAAFDPTNNPYRTIDSMPLDLTPFNGVESGKDPSLEGGKITFVSRQRGKKENEIAAAAGVTGLNNLWKQEPVADTLLAATNDPVTGHYFNDPFQHSLGYLNEPFGDPYPGSGPTDPYRGDPQRPFPWLTWNNRPYISQLELMLVPVLRSSKLLVCNATDPDKYYRFVRGVVSPQPYDKPATPAANNVAFPHLLNFFQSQKKTDPAHSSPQFHRLLEYVRVPSRFVGTEIQGNPAVFAAAVGHSFHPPFNRISRYREPGRINLNTIFSPEVFKGLMNYFPGMSDQQFWAKFVRSRRGYDAAVPGDLLAINSAYPTRFARPFRSFAGGAMVPLANMEPEREVDATLLRPDPADKNRPLFHYDHAAVPPAAYPDDTDRNPYFRYQGLQRLGNLVTTRSNVYAIWITVGYFEVEPAPPGYDPNVYPDGYRLGQELGIETGEIERHRAFYLIDRSIPVGFRRGQDLNVEKAVLLGRFIE